ncbi:MULTISPECIES: Lrp/AsnC family transcriptional regulator [unclassified Sphingomonas]|jgi:Lrp/AsnC family transcriptional regulator, leucine-responsive regulatory protein|uniref:Lrp/AsnC family transcriptional regulator n=1 Tax=unclassified Sphingomonas TaxID=196159 RepID=UPI000E10DBB1|nr:MULTISPECIES: Lrp/AsnC family transcriptional regulator [unclassified Sphingomonas]AXJ94289.1 transcriptional regulator [Sphingomonas sp. FARSPH]
MLDALDRRILTQLAGNSDLTSAELGDAVGLSPSAAHRRVATLRERGYIAGYRAILSKAARGDPSTVLVNVTLRDQREETMAAFEREIVDCREVRECFLMSGEADYMLHVEVRRDDTFERIHRETLSRLPGVARLASHFVIREVVRRG